MAVDVEKVVRENIDKSLHMSLATSRDNVPWICELHFAYDDDLNLYFISLENRRHSTDIATNNKVAGSIIDNYGIDAEAPVGVYFEAFASIVEDQEQVKKVAELLNKRVGLEKDYVISESHKDGGHKVYKLSVKSWCVFGRFEEDHGTKHTLEWNR